MKREKKNNKKKKQKKASVSVVFEVFGAYARVHVPNETRNERLSWNRTSEPPPGQRLGEVVFCLLHLVDTSPVVATSPTWRQWASS
jgi:hypothetical protein